MEMSVRDDVAEKSEEAFSQAARGSKDRVRSGIRGFDELTKGSLMESRTCLVAGSDLRLLKRNEKWVEGCVRYVPAAALRGNVVKGYWQSHC